MSEFVVEKCSTCQADIIWAIHERTLKPAPINAEPEPPGRGDLLLFASVAGKATYSTIAVAKRFGRRLRTSHYATCPQAGQHRRRGRVAA